MSISGFPKTAVSELKQGGADVSSSNPLPVSTPDGLTVSGTATSAAVLFTTSMLNYESITVQVTSAGTGCTISYETSCDNVTWVSSAGLYLSNIGYMYSQAAFASTTVGQFQFSRRGLYFRARVSTYGSGTVSIIAVLSKTPLVQLGLIYVGGGTYPEGSVGTNPVPIGLEARTSSKIFVASSTIVRPIATTDGRQIVRLDAIPENEWSYVAASGGITNTTTPVDIAGGAGSGVRNYVTSLQLYSDTLGTATEIILRDGAGGSILWRSKIDTAGTGGTQNIRFHPPIRGSTNTIMQFACVTATGTGSIYVNAQGYKAP